VNESAGASGGNSGIAIEVEIVAPPNTLLTGGPFTVGTGAPGMIGNGAVQNGGDSTLLIGGVLLTAPGGMGGNGANGASVPIIANPNPPAMLAVDVDYQASDLGGLGFGLGPNSAGVQGGTGGSGNYGIGGVGSTNGGNGENASGNGGGGGGAASLDSSPAHNGGIGSPGIWIIEEYS
jgi:hypothetical protein